MLNALTIDVEEYFHVAAFASVIEPQEWDRYVSRVEGNVERLLDILDEYHTVATFFVLGWVADRHPQMVRAIRRRGHEVASHGYAHQCIYKQTPEEFRRETRRSKQLLEDLIGETVLGYRAASYSITRCSLWALEILREEGFAYDSSIFPIRHDRYGIPGHPRFCHVVDGQVGTGLVEFPPSTVRVAGVNVPIAGGGYFRIYPYAVTRWGIRYLNTAERQPAVVYLHPWEIDPEQPRIPAHAFSRFRQYFRLDQTAARLARLLQDFSFASMASILRDRGLLRDSSASSGNLERQAECGTHPPSCSGNRKSQQNGEVIACAS
jgi:polysaccharide deacetylase family protein (PEP-CTERM system associated)